MESRETEAQTSQPMPSLMPQKSKAALALAVCLGFPSMYSIMLWGQTRTQLPHSQQLPAATTSFIMSLKEL